MIRLLATAALGLLFLIPTACEPGSYGSGRTAASEEKPESDSTRYVTFDREGRIWIFEEGSEAHRQFVTVGEPAKNVTLIGAGPAGETLKSDSKEVIVEWLAHKPGYMTEVVDERLWVLKIGSKAHNQFLKTGEPAKSVTLIGEGPTGMSVRSDSKATYIEYMARKSGFATEVHDERLWVFKKDTEAYEQFQEVGEPAKCYTMVGAGPMGLSVRSDSKETIMDWATSAPGFNTYLVDERIWVFVPGSEAETEFLSVGEPAKNATKINAGPMGMTVKSIDFDTINAYLAAVGS